MAFKDTTCLFTYVRNVSGGTMFFGFLPPHGRTLLNNQGFAVFGSIWDAVSHGDRTTTRRYLAALEAAIATGKLVIDGGPAPIVKDTVTGLGKQLNVTSGSLAVGNPCFASSATSDVGQGSI